MTAPFEVIDVEGHDRRFAVVTRPGDPVVVLVDRRQLEAYAFDGAPRLHLVEHLRHAATSPFIGTSVGRLHAVPPGPARDEVFAAVEDHDLPWELREYVPFAPPAPFRSLWARLRDWLRR